MRKNAQDGIYTEGESQTGYFLVPLRRTLGQNIICDIKEILQNLRTEPHFELFSQGLTGITGYSHTPTIFKHSNLNSRTKISTIILDVRISHC